MTLHRWFLVACTVLAGPVGAQRIRPDRPPSGDRPALEKRFRERLGAVMRERLGLNDEQAIKLQEVNGRFEPRRRELFLEEREVRLGLRRALIDDSVASNDEVATLMDRAIRVQRQRVDLLESEQRELSQFMSPVQRAKYFGFLEQLRRQMEDMKSRREGGGEPPLEGFGPGKHRRPGPRPG